MPYPVVGSLTKTWVTAPTSFSFWMIGLPLIPWPIPSNPNSKELDSAFDVVLRSSFGWQGHSFIQRDPLYEHLFRGRRCISSHFQHGRWPRAGGDLPLPFSPAGNITGARERSGAQAAARRWRECLRNRVVPHPEAAPAGAAPRADHR